MKKTLLSTAILAGLVSATAQAATVYDADGTSLDVGGRVEVRGDFLGNGGEKLDGSMQDMSRARIHLDGETEISEGLTGFGFTEVEYKPDGDFSTRYLFAGLGTQLGDFSYGKQDTANVQISNMTDIASVHSGIQQIINGASDKQKGAFVYSEGFFDDALAVNLDYVTSDAADSDSYGASALYSFDFGLDLGGSYTNADNDQNQATFGAAYTLNDLYVAVTYAMGDASKTEDFTSLEAAVQYQFTEKFRLIGILGNQDLDGSKANAYALEAQYRFNSALRTFVSYAYLDQDEIDPNITEDSLVAGLRYDF
ncbi:porin [Psychromonas sp. RZ22]|uniref:porin n=1 Tax=Psychromonas algarum TaxID=2555643 RepID=UPI001067F8F3|nr:porin [Psychromonas sp. RZ22]TEW54109.1 porin [Psychromonas sp. RZ22]